MNRACRCSRLLDSRDLHRTACPRAGMLSRRGSRWRVQPHAFAERCREGDGRVRTKAFVRDLDVPGAHPGDDRRLEAVVDGMPLFDNEQLKVDITLVCALHGDDRSRRRVTEMDGVVIIAVVKAKEPSVRRRADMSSAGHPYCGTWGEGSCIPHGTGPDTCTERDSTQ